jgi:hypothetical protein
MLKIAEWVWVTDLVDLHCFDEIISKLTSRVAAVLGF